ncbi:hypothetical protein RKK42_15880 [Klebsiella pneumoniae]|nr:hypothetical protein [Klebsiella pneumoniae]
MTGLYPPDFELTGLDSFADSQAKMGERLMNGRSVWETIRFVLTQPRNCHIRSIYFEGPTREKNWQSEAESATFNSVANVR